MNVAIIGDIHGSTSALKRIFSHLKQMDAIFVTGDIGGTTSVKLIIKSILKSRKISREIYAKHVLNDFHPEFIKLQLKTTKKIVGFLTKLDIPIFITHGNADLSEVRDYLKTIDEMNPLFFYLENSVIQYKNYLIAGYGYSEYATYRGSIHTPSEKSVSEIEEDLNKLGKVFSSMNFSDGKVVGLFHEPPFNTKLDYIPETAEHVGSKPLLNHVTSLPYTYIFAGHIHESQNFDKIGEKLLINPGPLVQGKWAKLDFKTNTIKLETSKSLLSLKKIIYNIRKLFP